MLTSHSSETGRKKSYWTDTGQQDVLSAENALHLSSSGGLTLTRLSAENMQIQGPPWALTPNLSEQFQWHIWCLFFFSPVRWKVVHSGDLWVCWCKIEGKQNNHNKIHSQNVSFKWKITGLPQLFQLPFHWGPMYHVNKVQLISLENIFYRLTLAQHFLSVFHREVKFPHKTDTTQRTYSTLLIMHS